MIREADRARTEALKPLHARRRAMKLDHRAERQRLEEGQRVRAAAEAKERSSRFRKGVAGLWDRLSGRHGQTIQRNEAEAIVSLRRDRSQRDDLIASQLGARRDLQRDILSVRHRHAANVLELHRDLARQEQARTQSRDGAREDGLAKTFGHATDPARSDRSAGPARVLRARRSERGAGRNGPRGPDLGR